MLGSYFIFSNTEIYSGGSILGSYSSSL